MTTRKTTPSDEPEKEPCPACQGRGLVRIDPKYQKTCQVCQGTKVKS